MVKVTPDLSFTTASATSDSQSYINAGLATGQFYTDLLADDTGGGSATPGPADLYTPLGTWAVGSDGTEALTRYYCSGSTSVVATCPPDQIASCEAQGRAYGQVRAWKLPATSGNNICVMERLTHLGAWAAEAAVRENCEKLGQFGGGDKSIARAMDAKPTPKWTGLSQFAAGSFCRPGS